MTTSVVEVVETTAVVDVLDVSTQQSTVVIEVDHGGPQGPPGDDGAAGVTSIPFVFASKEPGDHIVVETGTRRFYNPTNRPLAIKQIVAAADVAPGVQAIIYDVLINGTSIWNVNPALRVQVLPGEHYGVQTAFDTANLGPTDYFTADVIQVGDVGSEGSGTSLIIGTEG